MAQSDNWIDATGNWDDAPKWSAGVPDQDSDVTIGDTTNGNVTLNHAATIHSLTINASNVLALVGTASLTVAGDFANTGDFGNSGTQQRHARSRYQQLGRRRQPDDWRHARQHQDGAGRLRLRQYGRRYHVDTRRARQ